MKSSLQAKLLEVTKSKPIYNEEEITVILVLQNPLHIHKFNTNKTYHQGDVIFIESKTLFYMQGNKTIIEILTIPNSLFIKYHYEYMRNIALVDALEEDYTEKDIYYVYRDCIFIKDMVDAYTTLRSNSDNAKRILEEKLIISLINEYSTLSDRTIGDEQVKRYYQTLNYIHDMYSQKISLETVANKDGLRKTSFAQSYKQIANETFLDTVSRIRLRHAEHLLATTSLSNKEISELCGFSDLKYFYRDFRNAFSQTPAEYKKEINQYSQNYEVSELSIKEASMYLKAQNDELSYIKVDTRLYQQYLLIKELEFAGCTLTDYDITLDLYNEANYLMYNNNRYITWYGLNLLLNNVQKYRMKITFRLSVKDIRNEDEENELLHLLKQTLRRLTKQQQKLLRFEITIHDSIDSTRAHSLQIKLYQHCNITASITII